MTSEVTGERQAATSVKRPASRMGRPRWGLIAAIAANFVIWGALIAAFNSGR